MPAHKAAVRGADPLTRALVRESARAALEDKVKRRRCSAMRR
ncbi:MAG TPA: hypothetical protein VHB47_15670 [Thermoanaerobaculia bacterium]|nr:hypothetical protein [Thermoanaerobaculia bacterium]